MHLSLENLAEVEKPLPWLTLHLPHYFDCPQGANPFLLQDFLPIFWTFTLTWSSPSRLHSCLKTEITAVSPWTFPSCRKRLVGSLWFIVVVFLFSFLSVGVRVRRYLAQRKARDGGEVGVRVWSWSKLGLCRWEKNSLCSWVLPFSTSAPSGEKGRRKEPKKPGLSEADIFSIHSLWIFWGQCCQAEHLSSKQTAKAKQRSPSEDDGSDGFISRWNWRPRHPPSSLIKEFVSTSHRTSLSIRSSSNCATSVSQAFNILLVTQLLALTLWAGSDSQRDRDLSCDTRGHRFTDLDSGDELKDREQGIGPGLSKSPRPPGTQPIRITPSARGGPLQHQRSAAVFCGTARFTSLV